MSTESQTPPSPISLDATELSIEIVAQIARGDLRPSLAIDQALKDRVAAAADCVTAAVDSGQKIYGVTTGFGGMADQRVPRELAAASQNNLLSFLAAGAGDPLADRHVRAAMLLRASVLLKGCSGVRMELIERLIQFLQHDAVPVVRELGSIGASGDLVPLSTIARSVTGRNAEVRFNGSLMPAAEVMDRLALKPLELLPKEGLAMVNGTSFSSAIAANAVFETQSLVALSVATQAIMLRSLSALSDPFNDFVHQCKPHPGQVWVAKQIQHLLPTSKTSSDAAASWPNNGSASNNGSANGSTNGSTNGPLNGHPVEPPSAARRVQDRYSLRCLPQYMGPSIEALSRIRSTVEIEMNAVSDNPLIDAASGQFHQSGNFLGQYLAVAMDDLRRHIGLTAKHLDVQIATLVAPEFNGGLPASLTGNTQRSYNMGLKGLQITGNSIMPMLTYLGNPITEHFPTHAEQFNQNINGLSWGSANLAWKSVGLFQQYLSISLIFAVQAIDLRAKQTLSNFDGRRLLQPASCSLYEAVCQTLDVSPSDDSPLLFDDSDRWLEQDVRLLAANIANHGSIIQAVLPLVESWKKTFGHTATHDPATNTDAATKAAAT